MTLESGTVAYLRNVNGVPAVVAADQGNWRVDYSTIYDIEARVRSGQYIGITRDLHCWEIGFSRQQLGDEWEYYFRIALKAHPELYGESGDRGVGGGLMGRF